MFRARPSLTALLLLLVPAGAAFGVEGDWTTDPVAALRDAAASKRPILAVAMDHG